MSTTAWAARFRVPVVRGVRLADDAPARGLVTSNVSGVFQLHAWDVASGRLRALTSHPTGVIAGTISPDGRFVYYHDDAGGNELGHFVRVPFEGGSPISITPGVKPYPTFGLSISGAGNRLGFVTADDGAYHLNVIDVGADGALATSRRIHTRPRPLIGPAFSHDGAIAVLITTPEARSLRFELVALDSASGRVGGEMADADGRLYAVAFAPRSGDTRLLCVTNSSGVDRPFIWDIVRGTHVDLALDHLEGDVQPADWSPDGERVLLRQFARAVQRLYLYDVSDAKLTPLRHPTGSWSSVYFAPDGAIHALWEDSTHPPQVIALDGVTGEPTRTLLSLSAPDVPAAHPWRSIEFPSAGGQQIRGWLATPDGQGPFPTILHTHGGPEGVMTDFYLPSSQAWVDEGFAFLTINYRGSTTFGRAFLEQIWGNLGHWEVEDMVAAREWLVKAGVADPSRVFVTGWSYGGYLTLQALGTRPALWAGGMAGIAVADWAIAHEDTTDTLRGVRAARFGGTPQEQPERYAASSPITYAKNVQAPVLIIQGRNDTRTPRRSVDVYEATMTALGKSIEVHWFDAGHGSLVVDQAIEHHALMLDFAQRVLQRI